MKKRKGPARGKDEGERLPVDHETWATAIAACVQSRSKAGRIRSLADVQGIIDDLRNRLEGRSVPRCNYPSEWHLKETLGVKAIVLESIKDHGAYAVACEELATFASAKLQSWGDTAKLATIMTALAQFRAGEFEKALATAKCATALFAKFPDVHDFLFPDLLNEVRRNLGKIFPGPVTSRSRRRSKKQNGRP